ncbi:heavy metal-binding domain-containing protein [Terrimonas pollutisoli]|uniref:heavy metal-binding domain-containing protein n=1 Tax=Terrimonas pollutisoli TaxID=3034147 RepID=UPI0023EAE61D|nr:heavy metal-binding domain-containing protein [Terrimonas sp. H1YJ31]
MKSLKMLLMAAFSIMTLTVFSQEKAGKKDTTQHVTLYACPMHPDVTSEKPDKCSKCGMDLSLKEQMKQKVVKNYACPIHADVLSNKPGRCSKCKSKLVVDRRGSKQPSVVYTCTMHPDVTSDKSGKCPKCNMDLTEVKKEDHSGNQH